MVRPATRLSRAAFNFGIVAARYKSQTARQFGPDPSAGTVFSCAPNNGGVRACAHGIDVCDQPRRERRRRRRSRPAYAASRELP